MWNPKPTDDVFPNKFGSFSFGDFSQRFSFNLFGEVIDGNNYVASTFFPLGRGPMMSIPHLANGQGFKTTISVLRGLTFITLPNELKYIFL